jgi:mono/diheme cytochrome c family protein
VPSCKDQTTQTSDIIFPASGVSFTKQVEPLFQETCASCHNGNNPATNLSLDYTAYSDFWEYLIDYQPKIIISGNAANSILYRDISGNPQLMPPSPRPRLTQNQIDGIKTWITEGAIHN